jgi:O-acetyl-ADP-ribose deacetylase
MSNRIELIQADITKLKVDAIVNAANSSLMGGGGVDGAIHRAAGQQLAEECKTLGGCKTGQSKITKGYDLPAKYVIHTVGPVWNGGDKEEDQKLASCYQTSLELAVQHGLKTIAFPSISTGAYRFPFNMACEIALDTIKSFLKNDDTIEKVYLVVFSDSDLAQYRRVIERREQSN